MSTRVMPDVASDSRPSARGALNWVGMSHIELPLRLTLGAQVSETSTAFVQAYVNVPDADCKGIHMSRLYVALNSKLAGQTVTPALLQELLGEFRRSHAEISDAAFVEIRTALPLQRRALKSDNTGWKAYPVTLRMTQRGTHTQLECLLDVSYSSTCPCSAALARQLIQEGFSARFGGADEVSAEQVLQWLGSVEGIRATPHSQRSVAQVEVSIDPNSDDFGLVGLADLVENALGTPVQTAVKREDEQEFALLNGQNLMFCEDAARRVSEVLHQRSDVLDFWLRVNHLESLHPHDAVAVVTKGIVGGYSDAPGMGRH